MSAVVVDQPSSPADELDLLELDFDVPRPHRWGAWLTLGTAVWTAIVVGIGMSRRTATSWHFFDDAARFLFDRPARHGGGLHVFATHPQFQFGPVAVVVAEGLRLVSGSHTTAVVSVFLAAMAPVIVFLLFAAARRMRPEMGAGRLALITACGAAVLVPMWGYLAVNSLHIDDALALLLVTVALWAVSREQGVLAAVMLGLAVASKPWAVAFMPVLLALPAGRRLRPVAVAAVAAVGPWLPFVIGGPGTLSGLSHFRIINVRNSALQALGVHSRYTPSWDRAAQLGVGGLLALRCVRSGRWPAAVMAAVAIRIMLDPSTHPYYATGLVLAVLVWELLDSRWAWPVATLVTAAALAVPKELHWAAGLSGDLRLGVTLGIVGLAVVGPRRRPTRTAASMAPASAAREPVPALR